MGVLETLGWRTSSLVDAALADTGVVVGGGDVAQVDQLPPEIAEAYGINLAAVRVSRLEAMSISSVKRGRSIIAGTIGTLPLVALRTAGGADGAAAPDQTPQRVRRSLLEQPDPATAVQHTITWTVDDLLFHGISWWRVLARDATGFPSSAERVARSRVVVDHARRVVLVDGRVVPDRDLIRFDGPDEGLLATGLRGTNPLRTALKLEAAADRYADMDVPLGLLSDPRTTGSELTDTEVDSLLGNWIKSRRKRTVGWLGRNLKYEAVQHTAEQLQLVEARQHAAVEIARLLNLEAGALNAPAATGMTYSNTEAIRRGRIDSLAPFIVAIEQRLSMGDVTPRGQRVAFDTAGYIRGDEQQVITTAAAAVRGGLVTRNEARARWLDLPPVDGGDELTDPQPAPSTKEEAP